MFEKQFLLSEVTVKLKGDNNTYKRSFSIGINRIKLTENKESYETNGGDEFSNLNSNEKRKSVKCFIDTKFKVNTLILNSFDKYVDMDEINDCFEDFSSNTYIIQIILHKNYGGYGSFSQKIESLLAEFDDVQYNMDCKKTEIMRKKINKCNYCKRIDNCIPFDRYFVDVVDDWFNHSRTIKYGNISHEVTDLFQLIYRKKANFTIGKNQLIFSYI